MREIVASGVVVLFRTERWCWGRWTLKFAAVPVPKSGWNSPKLCTLILLRKANFTFVIIYCLLFSITLANCLLSPRFDPLWKRYATPEFVSGCWLVTNWKRPNVLLNLRVWSHEICLCTHSRMWLVVWMLTWSWTLSENDVSTLC